MNAPLMPKPERASQADVERYQEKQGIIKELVDFSHTSRPSLSVSAHIGVAQATSKVMMNVIPKVASLKAATKKDTTKKEKTKKDITKDDTPKKDSAPTSPAISEPSSPPVSVVSAEEAEPYRITIRLSGADPSAPAEAVTRALRNADVRFAVERIERIQP